MNQDRDRCPLCNRKLVIMAGAPTCPDCGYRNPYGNSQQPQQGQTGSQWSIQSTAQKDKSGLVIGVVLGIIVFLTALAAVALAGGVYMYHAYEESMEIAEAGSGGSRNRKQGSTENSDTSAGKQTDYRPESEMLIELVELIFDKDVDQVTEDELNSIVYLDFYEPGEGDIIAVDYELADGTSATCFPENQSLDTADLKCFSGLQWMMMDEDLDWGTDWSNLTNLVGLCCGSSLSEIAGVMDVSQLVWVQAESSLMSSGNTKIGDFKNLEYLKLDAEYMESLEGISGLQSLTELVLTDAERIDDFEELYDMPQLETLYIESKGLRDIGFVREMENLTQLGLSNTSVKNLDAIEDCADTLEVLIMDRNYEVEDYSVVLKCGGLEKLKLYVDYDFDVPMQVPDLSGLTNLKVLHLGNYDRFDNLGKLAQLEELTLESASIGDGEALAALANLKYLALLDMSVYDEAVAAIPKLPKLETLDLTDSFIWADISPVFGAPKLKYVYLNDAETGLEIKNMVTCESLAVLDMTETTLDRMLEDGRWDYQSSGSEAEIALQDIPEFFACLPNLETLYVPGHELEDVSFLADMQELYYLDVADNYITDLSPLAGLPGLEVVVCEDNPLHNREGLEDVVLIE